MPKEISKVRDKIIVKGARVNNLKNVDIEIPRNQLVVVTGLSGSGKSSLAFDVIFAEGNRRYLEGISSYARQFLDVGAKPDVDKIENLSPTISIDQKSLSRSPRSTVGTLTEIYDYLRVLFAKVGNPHCPKCGNLMQRKRSQEIVDEIMQAQDNSQIIVMGKVKSEGKSMKEVLRAISQIGYARVRFNGKVMLTSEALQIASDQVEVPVEVVIDRITLKHKNPDRERIFDSVETAFKIGDGSLLISINDEKDRNYNRDFICQNCQTRINEITPRHFSFNSPEGACSHCSGLGITKEVDIDLVMPNKNLSLAEGAILPWSKSNGRIGAQNNYLNVLKALGKEHNFSIETPVKKLSKEVLDIIFFGPDKREVLVEQGNDLGGVRKVKIDFEGVISMIKRKYAEASSDYVRNDLEKYMLEKVCPVCLGKRIKEEYLAVRVDGKSIDDIINFDLEKFVIFLSSLEKLGKE